MLVYFSFQFISCKTVCKVKVITLTIKKLVLSCTAQKDSNTGYPELFETSKAMVSIISACPTHRRPHQLQEGTVDRQHINVSANGRLVKRTGLAVQFVQAGLADGVRAAQADGLVAAGVKLIIADGAG